MGPKLKNQNKGKSNKKESQSYLADDENFQSFANQLAKLGLELRDITSDGNCCFRALSDQMTGNESLHLDYRKRVCQYMRQFKEEFEPFVAALIEDDDDNNNNEQLAKTRQSSRQLANEYKKLDAFEKYIKNLEQSGTYADNGCLVAFARLYQVDINIHQLNLAIWTIHGTNLTPSKSKACSNKELVRQLHLSYHNGEHYSSIRPIGDVSRKPTNINISEVENYKMNGHSSSSNNASHHKQEKSLKSLSNINNNASNYAENSSENNYSYDSNNNHLKNNFLTKDAYLYDNEADLGLDFKIEQIIEITKCCDISLIKAKLSENGNDVDLAIEAVCNEQLANDSDSSASKKNDSKSAKLDKKIDKKQRQMERQRIKILEQKEKEAQAKMAKEGNVNSKNSKVIEASELVQRYQQQNELQRSEDVQNIDLSNLNLNIKTKSI